MDPGAIMGVVVSLIILAIGVFAFFTVTGQTRTSMDNLVGAGNGSYYDREYMEFMMTNNNTTGIGGQVFNIVGIVMIIGAIMAIVGLVYNYVR
jgi:lipoprotein signal peptidase